MTAPATSYSRSQRITREWPAPLGFKEMDRQFPGSMDGLLLLGGGANIILQLALPEVGYGVAESRVKSGAVMHNPLKRARTTFTYLVVALQGTTEEKLAYRRAVNGSHAQVHSTEASPIEYNAFDPQLQLWVAACLFWGFIDAREKLRGPLSYREKQAFYQLASPLGTTLQVREDMWPEDLDAFMDYWHDGLERLNIDGTIRDYLSGVIDLKFLNPVAQRLFGPFNRFVTAGFLPASVREQMHMDWDERRERRFRLVLKTLSNTSRWLPRVVRQMPYNLMMRDFRRRLRRGDKLV